MIEEMLNVTEKYINKYKTYILGSIISILLIVIITIIIKKKRSRGVLKWKRSSQ